MMKNGILISIGIANTKNILKYIQSIACFVSLYLLFVSMSGCNKVLADEGNTNNGDRNTIQCVFPLSIGLEVFDSDGSHIQGIAASEDALFLSQDCLIVKIAWDGSLLVKKRVVNHTGDICWYKGELFTSVALGGEGNDSPLSNSNAGKGKIQVFDSKLNFLREVEIDRRVDGICCVDGVLYVGMGAKEQPSSSPHRVNLIGFFDAGTLNEIGTRQEIDYGYLTYYGIQNLATYDDLVYGTFYTVAGVSQVVKFNLDLNVIDTYNLPANQGFDIMPKECNQGRVSAIWADTIINQNTQEIRCIVNLWEEDTN